MGFIFWLIVAQIVIECGESVWVNGSAMSRNGGGASWNVHAFQMNWKHRKIEYAVK